MQLGNETLEGGIPLEHLITCVPSITVVTAQNGYKVIKLIPSKTQGPNSGKARQRSSVGDHKNTMVPFSSKTLMVPLLQSRGSSAARVLWGTRSSSSSAGRSSTCWRISRPASCPWASSSHPTTTTSPSSAASPTTATPSCWSCWRLFLTCCRYLVAWGLLSPRFVSILVIYLFPPLLQILGLGSRRFLTLTHRAQVKRFTQDLLKLLKFQASKKVSVKDFMQAYHWSVAALRFYFVFS